VRIDPNTETRIWRPRCGRSAGEKPSGRTIGRPETLKLTCCRYAEIDQTRRSGGSGIHLRPTDNQITFSEEIVLATNMPDLQEFRGVLWRRRRAAMITQPYTHEPSCSYCHCDNLAQCRNVSLSWVSERRPITQRGGYSTSINPTGTSSNQRRKPQDMSASVRTRSSTPATLTCRCINSC